LLHPLPTSFGQQNNQRMRYLTGAKLIPLLLALWNCGGGGDGGTAPPPPPAPVATVTISLPDSALRPGQNITPSVLLRDANGNTLANRIIVWRSTDSAVVDLSPSGGFSALQEGLVILYAQSEGKTSEVTVRVMEPFVALAQSRGHTCALQANGAAWCWGWNSEGEVGDNTATIRLTPRRVAGTHHFTRLSLADGFTCALDDQMALWCWGSNAGGNFGNNSTTPSKIPVEISSGLTWADVRTGNSFFTCGVTTSNAGHCWGINGGQLGNGGTATSLVPTPVAGSIVFSAMSPGFSFACGLDVGGTAYCWGSNSAGQLGNGSIQGDALEPDTVVGGLTFTQLASGGSHSCGLEGSGALHCWGYHLSGQLGIGLGPTCGIGANAFPCSTTPMPVAGTFTSVSAGPSHTCALTPLGVVYCWGDNSRGQRGNSCGISVDSVAYCWGANDHGQLGDGSILDRAVPTKVAGQP
jgi:alpha-tubulin suppressor-like RCC1 family protein